MGLRTAIARSVRVVRRPAARGDAWAQAAGKALAGPEKPPKQPGQAGAWVPVRSSWIEALRFVPTGRQGGSASYYAVGYIDMRTRGKGRSRPRAYRYGPGISQRQFNTWRVAASRGKYWWRYFTRRWSPAQRLY